MEFGMIFKAQSWVFTEQPKKKKIQIHQVAIGSNDYMPNAHKFAKSQW